ncbi:MAG: pyruvate kinase [Bacteroidales bacterium]|nr:pyruvate kinase [Bacteroidales bacterium]
MSRKKQTKIVATISDRRCDVEFLKTLYQKGMDVVRINTAHQQPEDTLKIIRNVREVSDKIPVLIDTKGPEIRTIGLDKDMVVEQGERVSFCSSACSCEENCIGVSYDKFAQEVPIGSEILIDDGDIALKVIEKTENRLIAEVLNKGEIKNRKSINVPGVDLELPPLTEKDISYLKFSAEYDVEFIAHSFVRHKEDVQAVQTLLDQFGSKAKIIAKIENQTGVDHIDEILDAAYGIMVARGDLGIEIPSERIPGIQRSLIKKATHRKKPVIIATQMLHSMINNPRPTRAEVSDVANAIYRETDAIMLSGETAYGDYAVEAVETMTKIALEVESSKDVKDNIQLISHDNQIAIFLADSAVRAAQSLNAKAIVLDTLTGRTGRYVAAFRGSHPVYAMCYNKRVMRELALSYGVYAEHTQQRKSTEEFKKDTLEKLIEKDRFNKEELIVIIGGSFGPRNGASFLDVSTVENLMHTREMWKEKI